MDIYHSLKLISCQVFSPNCQKITWGHHGGASDALNAPPPCYFFLRTKIIFPIKCTPPPHPLPITSHTHPLPTTPPPLPPTHHPQPSSLTPPPNQNPPTHPHHHLPTHPTQEPSNHPPWRKSGALMPNNFMGSST